MTNVPPRWLDGRSSVVSNVSFAVSASAAGTAPITAIRRGDVVPPPIR
jgi:hypothetical protein